jgi:hypothetical protein
VYACWKLLCINVTNCITGESHGILADNEFLYLISAYIYTIVDDGYGSCLDFIGMNKCVRIDTLKG